MAICALADSHNLRGIRARSDNANLGARNDPARYKHRSARGSPAYVRSLQRVRSYKLKLPA